MDEQVASLDVIQRQPVEKPQMGIRHFLLQTQGDLGQVGRERWAVQVYPVAEQGGQPASPRRFRREEGRSGGERRNRVGRVAVAEEKAATEQVEVRASGRQLDGLDDVRGRHFEIAGILERIPADRRKDARVVGRDRRSSCRQPTIAAVIETNIVGKKTFRITRPGVESLLRKIRFEVFLV